MAKYPAFRKHAIPFELSDRAGLEEKISEFKTLNQALLKNKPISRNNLVKQLRRKWLSLPENDEVMRQEKLSDGYSFLEKWEVLPLTELGKLNSLFRGKETSSTLRTMPLFIRDSKNNIVRQFPDHEALPELMDELSKWDQENTDFISCFVLHSLLLSIHPFDDGNGRVARACEWARLKNHGILFHPGWESEVIIHWFAPQYNQVLESCRSKGFVDEFIIFMLDGYIETGKALIGKS
jgi:hypothetical protein